MMKNWQDLRLWEKTIIGALIIIAAVVSPELMLFIDIGGLELAFGFLVLYYQTLIEWVEAKRQQLNRYINEIKGIILSSAICQPRVFAVKVVYCTTVLSLTGSLMFAAGFFFPAALFYEPYI